MIKTLYLEKRTVEYLRDWFYSYVGSFASDDPDYQRNIDLKEEHSLRVCREIIDIGKDLGLSEEELNFCEMTALFHDIGRFEQYARYNTFSDRHSVNHATYGVKKLLENGVLDQLDPTSREMILQVVSNHNRATLPSNCSETCLFYSKLLRDADKLDIWRVVTEYYHRKEQGEQNGTIELDLPDTPGISEDIYRNLMEEKILEFKYMQNLNDFKLMQVGWVYDVNFLPSLKRIMDRGYLELLRNALPESHEIKRVFETVQSYLDKKLEAVSKMLRPLP